MKTINTLAAMAELVIADHGISDKLGILITERADCRMMGVFVIPSEDGIKHGLLEVGLEHPKFTMVAYAPLMTEMEEEDILSVFAHECGHIVNGDLESPEYLDHVASGAQTPHINDGQERAADAVAAKYTSARAVREALQKTCKLLVGFVVSDLGENMRETVEETVEESMIERYKALDEIIERHFGA